MSQQVMRKWGSVVHPRLSMLARAQAYKPQGQPQNGPAPPCQFADTELMVSRGSNACYGSRKYFSRLLAENLYDGSRPVGRHRGPERTAKPSSDTEALTKCSRRQYNCQICVFWNWCYAPTCVRMQRTAGCPAVHRRKLAPTNRIT